MALQDPKDLRVLGEQTPKSTAESQRREASGSLPCDLLGFCAADHPRDRPGALLAGPEVM